jgi:hypothetical protein
MAGLPAGGWWLWVGPPLSPSTPAMAAVSAGSAVRSPAPVAGQPPPMPVMLWP